MIASTYPFFLLFFIFILITAFIADGLLCINIKYLWPKLLFFKYNCGIISLSEEVFEFSKRNWILELLVNYMKSISAILNKHGKDELYLGGLNNWKVIRQQISDSSLRDASRAIRE